MNQIHVYFTLKKHARMESFLLVGVNVRGVQNFPGSWGRNFVLSVIGKCLIKIKQYTSLVCKLLGKGYMYPGKSQTFVPNEQ